MQNTHDLLVGTLSIFIPSLISSVLRYLTPMRLGLWQGSWRLQIFSVELHNKRWNMWSSFSRRRSWIKPGVFIHDITATVSWEYYKELVYTYCTHVSEIFLRYHRYEKKKETTETSETPETISLDLLFILVLVLVVLVLSLVSFRWFRFVVSGFSWGQTRSEQMNKVPQIRLFRWYSGYILPRYFKLLCSMFTIRLAFYK